MVCGCSDGPRPRRILRQITASPLPAAHASSDLEKSHLFKTLQRRVGVNVFVYIALHRCF